MSFPYGNDILIALLAGIGIGIGLLAAQLTYRQACPVKTDSEADRQDALERFKLWVDFWKYFLVSFALVLITTLLGNTLKEHELGLQKIKQENEARIAETANLGSFLTQAMDENAGRKYAFASYFSHVVHDKDARERWSDYATFVEAENQKAVLIASKKMEVANAQAATPTTDPHYQELVKESNKLQADAELNAGIVDPKSALIKRFRVLDGGTLFKAGMLIDSNGSPHAYHPESSKGLDYLANAGSLITEDGTPKGRPVMQGEADPAPGFYISPTALFDPTKDPKNPRRYVDSETVPYIVIPPQFTTTANVKLGDLAAVINTNNGSKVCYAIVADYGSNTRIGEGSIALARELGVPDSPKNGGTIEGIIYKIFPGSGTGWPRSPEQIKTEGERLLMQWGGPNRMLKELVGSAGAQ